jgi:hypothetical protein
VPQIGGERPRLPSLPVHHPCCPSCHVPMWLVSIQHFADGNLAKDRLHYECRVCELSRMFASVIGGPGSDLSGLSCGLSRERQP